jgi:hypothetical protein
MKRLLQYRAPRRSFGLDMSTIPLSFLEAQLRDISIDCDAQEALEKRCSEVAADEQRIRRYRVREIANVGFRT